MRRWLLFFLAALGVTAAALAPWIRTCLLKFPDEPISVSTIYRNPGGDIQYFPLIAALSRGTVTDGTIKESAGTEFRSFPHATLLPHALLFAAFDAYGFIVADVLVALTYFSCLIAFFRTLGASWQASTITAMLVALALPLDLSISAEFGPISATIPLLTQIWVLRIPRPFVSEAYMAIALLAAVRVAASESPGRVVHWLALAITFGLVLQGDLHSTMILATASPFLLYCMLKQQGLAQALPGIICSGILFLAVVAPFIIVRAIEHPDIPVRWGVFDVNRWAGFDREWLQQAMQVSFSMCFIYFAARQVTQSSITGIVESPNAILRVRTYALVLLLAAFACKPMSMFILGKTVQPYHFENRTARLCSYFTLAFGVLWVDVALRSFALRSKICNAYQRLAGFLPLAGGLTFAAVYVGFLTLIYSGGSGARSHLRATYYQHTSDSAPSYRENFTQLADFLDRRISGDSVVATFDHQVYSWWLTFHPGHSFLVEPFVSSAPDEELETRLALLCHLLGMSTEEYAAFVQNEYVNTFFLGLAKYQASRWHTYSSLNDYTDSQQQAIHRSKSVWQAFIPQSELARLKKHYELIPKKKNDKRALDVIVLSNSGPERSLTPPADTWPLVFENDAFRVFSASSASR